MSIRKRKFDDFFWYSDADHTTGLHVGDSGAWIIDSSNILRVYGHVVASDVFGRGYVIPMNDTITDIGKGLARLFSKSFLVNPVYSVRFTPIHRRARGWYAWIGELS